MKPGYEFDRSLEPWKHGPGFWHYDFHAFDLPSWILVLATVVGALLYFVPTLVAFGRRHHNRAAIAVLNLLLGWTFFGWAVALVWAVTAVRRNP
jgi:uncharacterized membrane protein YhaH (DUF805 family)